MRAGELRHRVLLQSKSVARDSYGAEVITWVEFNTVWGSVEDLVGREFMEMRQTTAEITTKIRIRHLAGVVPEMRAVVGSRAFDIESIVNVRGRDRELLLMCKEIL